MEQLQTFLKRIEVTCLPRLKQARECQAGLGSLRTLAATTDLITTTGRTLRSARLLSALSPSTSTN